MRSQAFHVSLGGTGGWDPHSCRPFIAQFPAQGLSLSDEQRNSRSEKWEKEYGRKLLYKQCVLNITGKKLLVFIDEESHSHRFP